MPQFRLFPTQRLIYTLLRGIPSGYFVGRLSSGEGPAELVKIEDCAGVTGQQYGLPYFDTTATLNSTGPGTSSQVLHGNASGAPQWGAVSLTASISGVLPVANGGTGDSSFTNGQLLIGNTTGNTLTKATLTQGSGITITNGTGSITIATTNAGTFSGLSDVTLTSLADKDVLVYDSGASKWKNQRAKYVVASFVGNAVLSNSQVCLIHRFSKAVTFPANFGAFLGHTSEAGGTANATGDTVFNVDKAANASPNTFSNIGTITIGMGGVTPTFATSSGAAQSFSQGDCLRIIGPGTADATFAGFYATLVGYET